MHVSAKFVNSAAASSFKLPICARAQQQTLTHSMYCIRSANSCVYLLGLACRPYGCAACLSAQGLASQVAGSVRSAPIPTYTPSASPVMAPMRQALPAQHLLLNVHVGTAELNPSVAQQGSTEHSFVASLVASTCVCSDSSISMTSFHYISTACISLM
jgi:hypothetical protein